MTTSSLILALAMVALIATAAGFIHLQFTRRPRRYALAELTACFAMGCVTLGAVLIM